MRYINRNRHNDCKRRLSMSKLRAYMKVTYGEFSQNNTLIGVAAAS